MYKSTLDLCLLMELSSQELLLVFLNMFEFQPYKLLLMYWPFIYAHQIINWNSFFKPRAASRMFEFQTYQIITHVFDPFYAHQIINLWKFFMPSAASSLSQYVWISTLPNYYSCISRPLIYAHQIINLWNSFFKPRAASSLSQYVWLLLNPWFMLIKSLIYGNFSSQELLLLNMFEFQPYQIITHV